LSEDKRRGSPIPTPVHQSAFSRVTVLADRPLAFGSGGAAIAHARHHHRHRTNGGHHLALRPATMAHQAQYGISVSWQKTDGNSTSP